MSERVQKVLSQWGIASRRKAEKMILAGRIQINGQTVSLGDKVDLTVDILHVDGKPIKLSDRPQFIYLLLNKPPGVVSTCWDPQNRSTVIDLLPQDLKQGTGIHPVGRLDFASSGALILTNDGNLTLGLTHPRYHLPKTYLVELDRFISKKDLTVWRQGIILEGRKTLPAKVKLIESNKSGKTIEIILTEGRNRQIRRVAEKLGYQVNKLHRTKIGSICLNSFSLDQLPLGKYRHLQSTEINFLKNSFNTKL
ncbi:rRNA pseudouridine synthase [Waterburya agarophytonicola K14]|uniref:Pseudouridine synthase n=1 Tax=Waterburya agarophytonicola KI4 TaxID=2874699 RepID=A0A964FEM6_9CYAN|nr:pseudouridine synthase [Waterburya agarophytonicola]MCC0176082.1 rRNA pseudouridine synthase [Waterburya agarophytonicola KI4]